MYNIISFNVFMLSFVLILKVGFPCFFLVVFKIIQKKHEVLGPS